MSLKKIGIGAALAGSAVAIVIGGSTLASAGTPATGAVSSTSGSSFGAGAPGGSSDTAVSGAELTKVTAAMTAKDPTVTVTAVRQDADGSYDVLGTKAGARVMYDVSADLATFTAHTGGPGGGGRGHGGPEGGTTGTPPGSSGTATPSA